MNGNFSFLGGTEVPTTGIYPKPIILCLSEVAKWWPEDSIWPARVCHWPMQYFSFNWTSPQHSKFKKFHIKKSRFPDFLGKDRDLGTPSPHSSQIAAASWGPGEGGLSLELTMLGLSLLVVSVLSCRHVILHSEDIKVIRISESICGRTKFIKEHGKNRNGKSEHHSRFFVLFVFACVFEVIHWNAPLLRWEVYQSFFHTSCSLSHFIYNS